MYAKYHSYSPPPGTYLNFIHIYYNRKVLMYAKYHSYSPPPGTHLNFNHIYSNRHLIASLPYMLTFCIDSVFELGRHLP